ncbi:MAG: LysR family transcriptional regulator [Alcanivoracaceae bacterium]|nr:LysR family transcriptional regulator [Alcanivoracaceae bacterium]
MSPQDLNDLYYFAQSVAHGGFAAASRATGVPRSKLSRRVGDLEARLGVRLINRSTRRFSVTDIGETYYQHCRAMLVEAEAAQEAIDSVFAEPRGVIRMTCPITLLHVHIGGFLADFMARYPGITVHLEATNRRVDLINEGLDLAIRVRQPPLDAPGLALTVLSDRGLALLASPALVARYGAPRQPADLEGWPSLALGRPQPDYHWHLHGPGDSEARVAHQPQFVTADMIALRRAAEAGVGAVQLPLLTVVNELALGTLVRLLPDWQPHRDIIHVVYPGRRGLLPAVRTLIDELAAFYASFDEE